MNNILSTLKIQRKLCLSVALVVIFLWSVVTISWDKLLLSGGSSTVFQIFKALFNVNLSKEILTIGLEATLITLVYASAGMSIALVIALIFGTLASGILFENNIFGIFISTFSRSFLGLIRAIHELIWALLFVSSIGLSSYAAIFALAIPYGGILGRILADILTDAPKEPILSLRASGANRFQCFIYGYLPMVFPNMVSYALYRFECSLRSSAIMSFIGIAGIGYQIQLSLSDLKYDEVWTFLFFIVGLVILVDYWSSRLRNSINTPKQFRKKFNFVTFSRFIFLILLICPWFYIVIIDDASLKNLFTASNLDFAKMFFMNMFGVGNDTPAFLDSERWKNAILLTYDTVKMGVLAIGITAVTSLLTVLFASKNIANGELSSNKNFLGKPLFYFTRAIYIFIRSVPELVWAMIIVFILKPGIVPGAIALALHNIGILGKLWAEVIEDMDARPIRNLRLSGASYIQMLFYGVIPSVFPQFLSYLFYRAEVIIRTTIVVGLVGAGGLGQEFKLSLSYFDYTNLTLLLICYVVIVLIVDSLSSLSRRIVR
ncbi:MAG: phosphonate transporter permease [Bacillales bacterium]|jgi:phosphonate transport system permease protein|nr:phosphonate transporter permease [Bacillales bacterium]